MLAKAVVGMLVLAAIVRDVTPSALPDRHDKRTKEQELSDEPHDKDGMHNEQYDHEAFLGKEEAKTFEQLQPEESKLRLAKIVSEKIDQNHDGFVTEEEMIRWIKYIQRRYATDDALRQWKDHNVKDGKISWQSYKERVFGPGDDYQSAGGYNYKEMMERDKRRFNMADADNDGALSLDEFANFLHPEEADHMRDIVVLETMEDIDKNKDGYIDEAEYIGDMWPSDKTEAEPDWVKTEREHFQKWRDTNHDGKMDKDEVKNWIMPEDYDHAMAESKHLIHESDADKDGQLTKEEILAKYDLFVGSQATDFGEALVKAHDEF